MKKNKKGFTLIELLAVILILGIIALIAIPTIITIVDESKLEAFKTSVDNLVSAVENDCQIDILQGKTPNTEYKFIDGVPSKDINIKGKLPETGIITLDDKCNISLNLSSGKYSATKTLLSNEVFVDMNDGFNGNHGKYIVYDNGTEVYFNPETGLKCSAGESQSETGIKSGCMKWHIFNDDENNSRVNMILAHNTTGILVWHNTNDNRTGPSTALTQLNDDTINWIGVPKRIDSYSLNNGVANYTINYEGYNARFITANEIAKITNFNGFNELNYSSLKWYYLDSNDKNYVYRTAGQSNYGWLFGYTNWCTESGCSNDDYMTNGYWTATAVSGAITNAWYVYSDSTLNSHLVANANVGVRPVITIHKSNL